MAYHQSLQGNLDRQKVHRVQSGAWVQLPPHLTHICVSSCSVQTHVAHVTCRSAQPALCADSRSSCSMQTCAACKPPLVALLVRTGRCERPLGQRTRGEERLMSETNQKSWHTTRVESRVKTSRQMRCESRSLLAGDMW